MSDAIWKRRLKLERNQETSNSKRLLEACPSRRELIAWVAASAVATGLSMLLPNAYWYGPFGAAFVAINLVATILVTGVPFSLGAALLLTTPRAHDWVAHQSRMAPQSTRLLLRRFFVQFLITSLYMILFTFAAFGTAILQFPDVEPAAIAGYLPGALLTVPVFSFILCSLTSFIAVVLDEWRLATLGGSAILCVLALVTGFTPWMVSYNQLIFFSPYHLYRFTAIALSGHKFADRANMEMLIGIAFDPMHLIVPILTLIVISFSFLHLVRLLFRKNSQLWILEHSAWINGDDRSKTITDNRQADPAMKQQMLDTARSALKLRRKVFAIALVAFTVIFPPVYYLNEAHREEENITVLYETDPWGVEVAIGEWIYGEVEIPEPPVGQDNFLEIGTHILDWGSCPMPLHCRFGIVTMGINDFKAMNETERLKVVPGYSSITSKEETESGYGWYSLDAIGVHLWILRYEDPSSNSTQSQLRVVITVSLQPN